MLHISQVRGAIFDVDETLLDTGVADPTNGLHEQARLQATHEFGRRHQLPGLVAVTPEQNRDFFFNAPVHSLEGAMWHMLYATGTVDTEVIDHADPRLLELTARKNVLAVELLKAHGKPMEGAVAFIEWLADRGLAMQLALATTGRKVDVTLFLDELSDLRRFFSDDRIVTKDDVTYLKPHPEAFDKAFRSLGLPDTMRRKVLAFEDNPRGVASAKAAGLYTCAITTIYSREQLKALTVPPDLIADSFAEFRRALEGA